MSNRINRKTGNERGALLGLVVVIAAALAVLMVALITQAKSAVHRGNALLSREELRRMAEEKFTRDFLSLTHDRSTVQMSSAPVTFANGEVESHTKSIPAGFPGVSDGLYVVVVATLTSSTAASPHYIRLETILDWGTTKPLANNNPAPPVRGKTLTESIEQQLRASSIPEDMIQKVKEDILSQIKEMFGDDAESVMVSLETNEYRDNTPVSSEPETADSFYLKPISIIRPTTGPKIRVWKETYN